MEIKFNEYVITTDYKSDTYSPESLHKNESTGTVIKVIGKVVEVGYKGNSRYLGEFQDEHMHRIIIDSGNLYMKRFKNPYSPEVYGHGFIGVGKYKPKENERSYNTWRDMIRRGYSEKFKKKYPSYKDAIVCKEWSNYQVYAKWHEENYPGYPTHDDSGKEIKWQLDKDLLSEEGGKIYSPNTCVFLPVMVNTYIVRRKNTNTSGYQGVEWNKRANKWQARMAIFNESRIKFFGLFDDKEVAAKVIAEAREIEYRKLRDYLKDLGFDYSVYSRAKAW